ncbi:MAG: dockerin type I repeat-containing protein [Candidatus Gastranaerophilaceae bacterium]|jgi:hypothetical protein|nr:dockerin type I repeat-containing protein [Christensenellales bacterium]
MLKKRKLLAVLLCLAMLVSMAPAAMADHYGGRLRFMIEGDANLDGTLNSDDALFILKYLKGETTLLSDIHKSYADANNDRRITIDDAIAILEGNVVRRLREGIWLGDVNIDGLITAADASLLLQYCNGSVGVGGIALPLADFNNDGIINMSDVYALLDYLAA